MEDYLKDLYRKAKEACGRDVEVEKTKDGKYIVLWLSFSASPPPKADCAEDALESFIKHVKKTQEELVEKAGEEL